ncbi:hypothetical protein PV05_05630 [Exophiala xenobiotica]|uniref:Uncharacterized protein n=1 Tax=Exophiala xenobiotica TaxID=348802 RepID=A0A0D2EQM8_9EURO|nr:uncharacterized protein PV05_05630 [Exophiala xenobiotica]KIW57025.1 hypothetical protein PV05_05630 [Exophiala xenobiotica]
MPSRWLSLRLRDLSQHDTSHFDAAARQPEFDFAFPEPTSPLHDPTGKPLRTARPVNLRPATSGGATGKRKPRIQLPSTRPQTSENHKHQEPKNTNATAKPENNLIGLAFGSPSHPPPAFGIPPSDQHSSEYSTPCRHRSRLNNRSLQMQSKKWRKIGTLFRSRQVEIKREEVPPGPTIGLPTGLMVLDKSPTSQSSGFAEHKPRPIGELGQSHRDPPTPPKEGHRHLIQRHTNKTGQKPEDDMFSRPSTATDASIWSETYTRPPVPKLEIDIPGPPLDRYSVMFRNLPAATRSSSLLARRSKTLESLRSFDDSRPNTKAGEEEDSKTDPGTLTPLMPPRFLGTPTSTRSPAATKYSLFPNTSPAPVKIHGRASDHDRHPLKRTASSPARLSPMQDRFSMAKPEPLNPKRVDSNEQMVNSPDDNTASTDREAPWSAAHSFQSSISSATTTDEIFFDIKSFRDSKGVEDGHFVMTRPDSAAVELVRTRSKKVVATSKLRQAETAQSDQVEQPTTPIPPPAPTSISNLPSAATTKHTSVNTAYFDEAIAAVERLTSPTTMPQESLPPITFTIPTVTVATHSDDRPAQPTSSSSFHSARPSDIHITRLTSRSREEISRLIPSPVTEVKEDLSPKSDTTITKAPSPSPQPQAGKTILSPRIAAVRRVDRPIDDSPTIPQGPPSPTRRTPASVSASASSPAPAPAPAKPQAPPPANNSSDQDDKPPPVPKKDAKFIPLSKYAAKSTVSKIEQAGIIPTRPSRANTDNSLSLPPRSASISVRTTPKERSATLPSSLQGLEKTVPPAPAAAAKVNPMALNPVTSTSTTGTTAAAEVAVARTVSLSRKQSARVNVPPPRLLASAPRRAEAAAHAGAAASSASTTTTTQTASAPANASSRSGGGGQGHERTVSKSGMGMGILQGHRHRRSASKSSQSQSKDNMKVKITKREPDTKKIKDVERQMVREAKKWEILEKKAYSPVVVQAERGHKPGLSVGLVVESI